MSEVLGLLPSSQFQRIHKSHIINLNKIDTIETHQVKIGDLSIPIGQSYRSNFLTPTVKKQKNSGYSGLTTAQWSSSPRAN
jgi:hypothetical protein